MKTVNPADLAPNEFYRYMIGTVGPRPIAFASTVDSQGNVNLSPFSFFNIAGYNPPTLIFIPTINRRGHKKHTLLNLGEVGEVVINIVNYAMVEQMSLTSAEFERGINEFEKGGFTAIPSDRVRPPRVAESPASYECLVRQIIPMNQQADLPGAGHLVVCEIVMAHFQDTIFDEAGLIDPHRIDLIGRMGGDWYARAQGDALFEVTRPKVGIGVDQLPDSIRNSAILSGNDLGKLGSFSTLPTSEEISTYRESGILHELFEEARYGCQYLPDLLHLRAKKLLADNNVKDAWLTLLQQA
ncbi:MULTISPECIES: flavin reductase family protein [unclassified Spirosoma]|uniref:flavin reductase family protein n=1 Tax=unclassified Spirosoma TaxID=2621999 RepID=UPI0009626704|nr:MULTISPECIES: flavin reductase family protein [unclassified Spirosoma]MBN8821765.1 flavin reductase family protein [Spirosoma sp.]OJW80743.1 MAG: flavin reductase [Spirosoma sp. 48-14]